MYFVSKALSEVETRYLNIEQVTLALRMAAKKLCLYFQPHIIIVLTGSPIGTILHKPDASRKLLKWVVELSEFHIEYRPRIAIKGQALVEFIVESSDAYS